jgi:hypothetical protein
MKGSVALKVYLFNIRRSKRSMKRLLCILTLIMSTSCLVVGCLLLLPIIRSHFSPEALLHGGEHWDDVSRNVRVSRKSAGVKLPRERMCDIVERLELRRPTPNTWTGITPASALG